MHTAQAMLEAYQAGQPERALAAFDGLPEDTRGHPLLVEIAANVCGQLGLSSRELALWEELARLCPHDERVGRNFATLLLSRGQVQRAVEVLEDREVRSDEGVALLAQGYLHLERYRESAAVLAAMRGSNTPHGPLGVIEARARMLDGDRAAARDLLAAVAADDPSGPTIRALGRIWREMHAIQQAIVWFEKAVAFDPDDRESWEALAGCFEQIGARARAARIVGTVRERFGPTPGSRRIALRLHHHAGRFDEARETGGALLAGDIPAAVRRSVLLELAQVEREDGQPRAAFVRAREGNALAKKEFAARGYPAGVFNRGVRRVVEQAHRQFAEAPPRTSPRPAPVFLVGIPCSGTRLVQQALQVHPGLVAVETDPATRALKRHCRARPGLARVAYPDRIAHFEPDDWAAVRRGYWSELEGDGIDMTQLDCGARVLDRLPLSVVRLQWLARLFPDAHAVLCLRDPREAAWSNFCQDHSPNLFSAEATDLTQIADFIGLVLELWLAWREAPPMPTTVVRYEQLVSDPCAAITPVFGELGLATEEVLASIERRTRDFRPPQPGGEVWWHALHDDVKPLLERLESVAVALGYPPLVTPGVA